MSKLIFSKYEGAGNDFILIDDRSCQFNIEWVPKLCHRKFGIGADGVILLQSDAVADFRMRIFNNDGSEAESCGNGLRCLARFLIDLQLPKKPYKIATFDRMVEVDFLDEKIKVQMGKPTHVKQLCIEGKTVDFLNTGVPHGVLFVPDVHAVDVMKEGAFWRNQFQSNVNFATVRPDGILVRTFERGLEAESVSCGTGAAAVAFVAFHNGISNPIQIHFSNESKIIIEIHNNEITMIGEARKIFDGEIGETVIMKRL